MVSSKTRNWIIIIAVVAVAAVLVYGVWIANRTVRNAYAVWWVGDMVVEHMKANDGAWPASWQDLEDDYQRCVDQSGQPWTFEELKDRVEIDWNAKPEELIAEQKDGVANFRVIWLRDGSNAYWQGKEPNQIVLDYLIKGSGSAENVAVVPDDHVRITVSVSEYLVNGWRDNFVDGFNVENVVVFEVHEPAEWKGKTFSVAIPHDRTDKLAGVDQIGTKREFVIEKQMLRLAIDSELHLGWGAIEQFRFQLANDQSGTPYE